MKETILLFQLLISREWFLKTHYIPGKLNVIQAGSSSAHRVVTVPSGGQGSVSVVGLLTDRSVCHKVQSQVSSVCISSTRPVGLGDRHFVPRPGGSRRVCLPFTSTSDKFSPEVSGTLQVQDHSDSTVLAKPAMVSQTESTGSQGADSVASQAVPHQITLVRYLSQSGGGAQPPYMASREVDLQSRGFSRLSLKV